VIPGGRLAARLAARGLARTACRATADRATWALAALAELEAVPDGWPRARFALGARFGLWRAQGGAGRRLAGLAAVPAAIAVLALVDRTGSDDGGQLALGTLLCAAGLCGALHPRRWVLVGSLVGVSLAAVHAVSLALGAPPPYAMHPAGWRGVASLLVLVVPGLVAACVGAAAARHRA
jgi:hypothetical protein